MTDRPAPHRHDDDGSAAQQLADYFRPDGFPGFTLDTGRAWTSEQVRQVLIHHREFLRGIIGPSVSDVLAENRQMHEQIDALRTDFALQVDGIIIAEGAEGFIREYDHASPGHAVVSRLVGDWQPADADGSEP